MWQKVSAVPGIEENQVHLWKFSVADFRKTLEELATLLSKEELERAERFRFAVDRETFVTARANLRTLLGRYIGQNPKELVFEYNEQGKPSIVSDCKIQFNISHSKEMILMGFTLNHAIGVDIEYDQKPIEIPQVARSFFSKNETYQLLSLPEKEQLQAFYNCWTRKEAFIKAKGGGLSIPLDQFEVSLFPDEPAQLKKIYWDQDDVSSWSMKAFKFGKDYTGACIVHNKLAEYLLLDGNNGCLETI